MLVFSGEQLIHADAPCCAAATSALTSFVTRGLFGFEQQQHRGVTRLLRLLHLGILSPRVWQVLIFQQLVAIFSGSRVRKRQDKCLLLAKKQKSRHESEGANECFCFVSRVRPGLIISNEPRESSHCSTFMECWVLCCLLLNLTVSCCILASNKTPLIHH